MVTRVPNFVLNKEGSYIEGIAEVTEDKHLEGTNHDSTPEV
jgi:hypothetical protein